MPNDVVLLDSHLASWLPIAARYDAVQPLWPLIGSDAPRAAAAAETIGAAMSAELDPGVPDAEMRAVPLDAAAAVLARRGLPVGE